MFIVIRPLPRYGGTPHRHVTQENSTSSQYRSIAKPKSSTSYSFTAGEITGSGRVTLLDRDAPEGALCPEDLELEKVLGDMPNKTYHFSRVPNPLAPLALPAGTSAMDALRKVLRLPSVGSKRFLTNKVDRAVTGLIAQQQCVATRAGPLT